MATANSTLKTPLNERDEARITGLSVASVRRWRPLRQGPKWLKIGAAHRYKPTDVLAGLSSHDVGRQTVFQGWLYACLRRFAILAGVEALRAVIHHVLGKLG